MLAPGRGGVGGRGWPRMCTAFIETGRPGEGMRIVLAALIMSDACNTQAGPSGSAEGVRMGWKYGPGWPRVLMERQGVRAQRE